jgi:hypothetical protein
LGENRLCGTFIEEKPELSPIYRLKPPLTSQNPFKIAFNERERLFKVPRILIELTGESAIDMIKLGAYLATDRIVHHPTHNPIPGS